MSEEIYIAISELCLNYKIDKAFLSSLNHHGLIEFRTIKQSQCIHRDSIAAIEKMVRIHYELNVNIEGIDVVFNLLNKIDALQNDLNTVKNRLKIYEN